MSEFEDGPGNVIQETLEYLSKLDLVVSGRLVAGESLMEDDEDSFDGGRQAMNAFFAEVNKGVGAKRLEAVPKGGTKGGYTRSEKLHAPPVAKGPPPGLCCHAGPSARLAASRAQGAPAHPGAPPPQLGPPPRPQELTSACSQEETSTLLPPPGTRSCSRTRRWSTTT